MAPGPSREGHSRSAERSQGLAQGRSGQGAPPGGSAAAARLLRAAGLQRYPRALRRPPHRTRHSAEGAGRLRRGGALDLHLQRPPATAAELRDDSRPVRHPRRTGGARHSCRPPASEAGRGAGQPPRSRPLAGRSRESPHRPRRGEPLLAADVRHRTGEKQPRFRHPGIPSEPSGVARLARRLIPGRRLGRETARPSDGDEPCLPPAEQRPVRELGERSRKPDAVPRTALPARCRADP